MHKVLPVGRICGRHPTERVQCHLVDGRRSGRFLRGAASSGHGRSQLLCGAHTQSCGAIRAIRGAVRCHCQKKRRRLLRKYARGAVQRHTDGSATTFCSVQAIVGYWDYPLPLPQSSSGLSGGAIIGIAVGCPVAFVLLVVLACVWYRRAKRARAAQQQRAQAKPAAAARSIEVAVAPTAVRLALVSSSATAPKPPAPAVSPAAPKPSPAVAPVVAAPVPVVVAAPVVVGSGVRFCSACGHQHAVPFRFCELCGNASQTQQQQLQQLSPPASAYQLPPSALAAVVDPLHSAPEGQPHYATASAPAPGGPPIDYHASFAAQQPQPLPPPPDYSQHFVYADPTVAQMPQPQTSEGASSDGQSVYALNQSYAAQSAQAGSAWQ